MVAAHWPLGIPLPHCQVPATQPHGVPMQAAGGHTDTPASSMMNKVNNTRKIFLGATSHEPHSQCRHDNNHRARNLLPRHDRLKAHTQFHRCHTYTAWDSETQLLPENKQTCSEQYCVTTMCDPLLLRNLDPRSGVEKLRNAKKLLAQVLSAAHHDNPQSNPEPRADKVQNMHFSWKLMHSESR